MKNNKQDINGIDKLLLKKWKITRRVSRYKVEHFFGKLKKCFKCFIIINDKTLKNYYSHIDTSFILLSISSSAFLNIPKMKFSNNFSLGISKANTL